MTDRYYHLPMRFICYIPCLCRAKELRRQQWYRDKSRFEPGVWNVNTVIMGGLGGDPELSSSSDEGMYPMFIQCAQEILESPGTRLEGVLWGLSVV